MFWNFTPQGPFSRSTNRWTACLLACFAFQAMMNDTQAANPEPTHKAALSIYPKLDSKKLPFKTFSMSPQRELWLCCSAVSNQPSAKPAGKILVYSVEGQFLRSIDLAFAPQAIGFSQDGSTAFVAGSGTIAKLGTDGSVIKSIDAPNVGNKEEALEEMRKAAEEQSKQMRESMQLQVSQVEKQIAKMEEAPEEETEAQEKRRNRRLKILKQQLDQFEQMLTQVESAQSAVDESSLTQLMRSTGVAVSKQDLFVSLPTSKGFGYDVWRMNFDLEEPTIVIKRGSGCCGQYDIQSDGENLVIAENGSFQVAVYDRDGKAVSHFGERATNKPEGFGSCCNPMNVRCCENGDVLTAESSIGHIKRFSSKGEFLGFVGTAPIGGGCKHVAIAHDTVSDRYFMFNQDRSCISVLVPIDKLEGETEDEKLAREAREGLGKKLLGSWEIEDADSKKSPAGLLDTNSINDYYASQMKHVTFHENGKAVRGQTPSKEGSKESAENQGLFGLLTKIAGEESSADAPQGDGSECSWKAISQTDKVLTIAFFEGGIQSFNAKIEFENDKAMMTLHFGSDEAVSGQPLIYHRTKKTSE